MRNLLAFNLKSVYIVSSLRTLSRPCKHSFSLFAFFHKAPKKLTAMITESNKTFPFNDLLIFISFTFRNGSRIGTEKLIVVSRLESVSC